MKGNLDAIQKAKAARYSLYEGERLDRLHNKYKRWFCLIYEPVDADYENDTAETIKQIDHNNIVYDDLCENKRWDLVPPPGNTLLSVKLIIVFTCDAIIFLSVVADSPCKTASLVMNDNTPPFLSVVSPFS